MEMLHTALSALSKPEAGDDGTRDIRPAALRRAEAFTELLRRHLNSGNSPVEGYERPHVSLLIREEDLAAAGEGTDRNPPAMTYPRALPRSRPGRILLLGPTLTVAPIKRCSAPIRSRRDGCPGSARSPRAAPGVSRVTVN